LQAFCSSSLDRLGALLALVKAAKLAAEKLQKELGPIDLDAKSKDIGDQQEPDRKKLEDAFIQPVIAWAKHLQHVLLVKAAELCWLLRTQKDRKSLLDTTHFSWLQTRAQHIAGYNLYGTQVRS